MESKNIIMQLKVTDIWKKVVMMRLEKKKSKLLPKSKKNIIVKVIIIY